MLKKVLAGVAWELLFSKYVNTASMSRLNKLQKKDVTRIRKEFTKFLEQS